MTENRGLSVTRPESENRRRRDAKEKESTPSVGAISALTTSDMATLSSQPHKQQRKTHYPTDLNCLKIELSGPYRALESLHLHL
jgi:hypothetical protein